MILYSLESITSEVGPITLWMDNIVNQDLEGYFFDHSILIPEHIDKYKNNYGEKTGGIPNT